MALDASTDQGVDTVAESVLSIQEEVTLLLSHQAGLRLRHLSQIVARNLATDGVLSASLPASPLPSCYTKPVPQIGHYFTLHIPGKHEDVIYTSELNDNNNPSWSNFDVHMFQPINIRSLKGIIVRIWFKSAGECEKLVTTWGVNLNGLVLIGNCLPHNHSYFSNCTLIFKLRDLYYTAFDCLQQTTMTVTSEVQPISLRSGLLLPLSETKPSYTVSALSRFHSTKRAQRQQEMRCEDIRESLQVQHGIRRDSETTIQAAEVEFTRLKVARLREQLEAEIDRLRSVKLSADNLDANNQDKGIELLGGYQGLNRQLGHTRKMESSAQQESISLLDFLGIMNTRRQQLIRQLPLIFPITQDSNGHYFICGARLPNAEEYDGVNDSSLSVALGYVAHLLIKLSQILNVTLRFPINTFGSQSTIIDNISTQLQDTSREFPLYSRGKEKEKYHFNYGVFLLNKNIAQLRWYCNIPTPNLRITLANISQLIDELANISSDSSTRALIPDALSPHLIYPNMLNSVEVHTPTSLLEQKHFSPRLPLNPVMPQASLEQISGQILSSSPGTENHVEGSSGNHSPYGKTDDINLKTPVYYYPDKYEDSNNHVICERLGKSNGISLSLDYGLNHIGSTSERKLVKISDQSSFDESIKPFDANKVLSHISGSDPNLSLQANDLKQEIKDSDEEIFPAFQEQTTELLKSWHEGESSHYHNALLDISSTERLEEVGVECTENFMCLNSDKKLKVNEFDSPNSLQKDLDDVSQANSKDISSNNLDKIYKENDDSKNVEIPKKNNDMDTLVSLCSFGIPEDTSFNDVAFRTAVLANQNCSFKMSFTRQNTPEEFN